MMKLGHASQEEQDAAAKVVHADVDNLINRFMSSGMASMFRNQAKQYLESAEGRRYLLAIVDHALDAAEAVRIKNEPPPSSDPVKPHD